MSSATPPGAEEEELQHVRMPFAEAVARARAGGFAEGQTALTILLAAAHLDDAGQGPAAADGPSVVRRALVDPALDDPALALAEQVRVRRVGRVRQQVAQLRTAGRARARRRGWSPRARAAAARSSGRAADRGTGSSIGWQAVQLWSKIGCTSAAKLTGGADRESTLVASGTATAAAARPAAPSASRPRRLTAGVVAVRNCDTVQVWLTAMNVQSPVRPSAGTVRLQRPGFSPPASEAQLEHATRSRR